MNKLLLVAIVAAIASPGSAALAQNAPAGSDYSGQAPWQPRTASDRLVALQTAQSIVANRNGRFAGGVGGGWGGASGLGTAQGFGNYFSVTNNVSCSGEGGAIVTCTGGTNTVSGTNQTNSGNQTATNDIRDNTVTTTNTGNSTTGDVINGPRP